MSAVDSKGFSLITAFLLPFLKLFINYLMFVPISKRLSERIKVL